MEEKAISSVMDWLRACQAVPQPVADLVDDLLYLKALEEAKPEDYPESCDYHNEVLQLVSRLAWNTERVDQFVEEKPALFGKN